jgi:hypothetical protein
VISLIFTAARHRRAGDKAPPDARSCRWPGDLSGVGQEVGPLKSADARHEFWVIWLSFG